MRIDTGFMDTPGAQYVQPNPDNRYDALTGEARLAALEAALSSTRGSWDDDQGKRADDWIKQSENLRLIIVDLGSVSNGGAAFPRVWEAFGWAHFPTDGQSLKAGQQSLDNQVRRVLGLIAKLPKSAIRLAIGRELSHWMSAWEKEVIALPDCYLAWSRALAASRGCDKFPCIGS